MRSVVVDGVERDLKIPEGEDFSSVLVKGFSITRVSYEMSEFIMTDVDHYSGNVSLQFMSDNPDKMPKTVVGKFVCDDGSEVNVNFAYNATTTSCAGTANFTSSGEYTMQYVVLDGQYVELAESQQKTVDLTLGMRVNVQTSSPMTIFYGEENAPKKLAMQVKILDNNNDIIKSLADVTLTYKMTETEKLEAVLKYNSGRQWYEGEFNVESGTWKFDNVTIKMGNSSTNELRKVNTDAPVFQIIPPDPPSYLSNFVEKVQYRVSDKYASFAAKLADSGSAVVYAKLENEKDETLYVAGNMAETSINGQYDYEFVIEDTGYWTMKSVSVFDAFDQDQKFHPVPTEMNEDNYNSGIVFDSANTSFEEIDSVVLYESDVTVSYSYDNDLYIADNTIIVGKNKKTGEITRSLMESHTFADEAIKVTINDTANLISQGYFNVENVTLSYKYGSLTDANGNSYGEYTSSDYVVGTNVGTFNFAANNKTLFTLTNSKGSVVFDHSAQYTPDQLSYTIKSDLDSKINISAEVKNNLPHKVVLYSIKPSAYISSISPTGTIASCSSVTNVGSSCSPSYKHSHTSVTVNQVTNATDVTVYFACDGGSTKVDYDDDVDVQNVTITLKDSGNATETKLAFASQNSGNSEVRLYTSKGGSSSTSEYIWSNDATTCKRWVGKFKNNSISNDEKTPAGTLKAEKLIMKAPNGAECTVDITDIYIRNPR